MKVQYKYFSYQKGEKLREAMIHKEHKKTE